MHLLRWPITHTDPSIGKPVCANLDAPCPLSLSLHTHTDCYSWKKITEHLECRALGILGCFAAYDDTDMTGVSFRERKDKCISEGQLIKCIKCWTEHQDLMWSPAGKSLLITVCRTHKRSEIQLDIQMIQKSVKNHKICTVMGQESRLQAKNEDEKIRLYF